MKNSFIALFICLLTLGFISQKTYAQASLPYEATLPLYDKERLIGEVKVLIADERLVSVDKASLLEAIKDNLQEDTIKSFEALNDSIDPKTMPLPMSFNVEELKLEMPFKVELRTQESLDILEDYHHRYENEAIRPAPFGGAINSRLEQSWTNNRNEQSFFGGQFETFLNIKNYVFENQSFYQSNVEKGYFRGDARVVKDFERQQVRVQAGDVHPQIQGFMIGRPIGGINIARNFSLNPYRLPYPTGTQNFVLQSRSLVKYYVNGTMIKSEYLPAGNYTAKDIPLNNGLNTIMIEATDELGQKKVFVFRSSASINLLNEGESKFDLSYGTPFMDQNYSRDYRSQDGNLLSGFYQYGFNSSFSTSVYGQNQKNYSLLGSELIKATVIGNLGTGLAHSQVGDQNGTAQSLNYQFLGSGTKWYFSHSLGLRYEHRQLGFRSGPFDSASTVQNNYSGNYALPVAGYLTLSVGANYGDVRDNDLSDRYGVDTTLNVRLFNRHNVSFFLGRSRDENKVWNDVAYVFVTITFADSNDFISSFYDQKQDNTKVTYIHDNQNRLYSPKAQVIAENNPRSQMTETDLLLPTQVADFGARLNAARDLKDQKLYGRSSFRLNSALVFARQNNEWGIGISRPVPSSFVLFKPDKKLKGQKIALKSSSPFTESETGPFGEITFANLLPYQYREVQLDPTLMDEGRTLKKEKYVLYPTYRSAHLIHLEDKGAVMLRGFLKTEDGKPHSLQVGHVGDKPFFTNRSGEFFIEGLGPGNHQLRLEGFDNGLELTIGQDDSGIKNIGTLILSEDE